MPRRVKGDHAAVRALKCAVVLVASRRLRPPNVPKEATHPLDVPARQGDQADSRRELHPSDGNAPGVLEQPMNLPRMGHSVPGQPRDRGN